MGFGYVKKAPELILFSEFHLFSMVGDTKEGTTNDGAIQSRGCWNLARKQED
jgi:hypothetical protein